MDVVIYHNPDCSASRNTLGLIHNAGVEPHVVEYLKTPPSRIMLEQLIARMNIDVRDLLREKGTPYQELGLADRTLNESALLDAMMAHPILINRPIVVTPLGCGFAVRLKPFSISCRPSDANSSRKMRTRDRHERQGRGVMQQSLARRVFSEWLGTAFLLAAVVGSGIMAQKLSGGNVALALLCNTIPTGAILVVLILIFGPLSGAHFNPAVSIAFAMRRELPWSIAAFYIAAQIVGAVVGDGQPISCSNCRFGNFRSPHALAWDNGSPRR